MKNITKILFAIAFVIGLGSCEKWIDPNININPDAPIDMDLKYVLSSAQVEMAYVLGGADITGITSMWMQQVKGADRQFKSIYETYNLQGNNLNNCWENLYAGVMNDLNNIILDSQKDISNSAHFRGVSKVMMAYCLGTATSLWGDIPYSEAFGKSDNLKPSFDTQQQIYATINTLLTEAIAELNAASVIPLSGDLIYDNSVAKWSRLAYSLRAKYAMHLTKKGSVNYTNVLSDLANGITSGEDFKLIFGTTDVNANPLYQFRDQREGYAAVDSYFDGVMTGDNRSAVMNDVVFGTFYSSIDSPVALVTYAEMLYIKAEAMKRNSDTDANIAAVLTDANSASAIWYGVTDNATVVSATPTIQEIIETKYKHMFLNVDAFTDYRRTGFPVLVSKAGAFPQRFPYASDEAQYNPNTPANDDIRTALWAFN